MNYFFLYESVWYIYDGVNLYHNPYKTILKKVLSKKGLKFIGGIMIPYTYNLLKSKKEIKEIELDDLDDNKIKYV